MKRTIKKYSAYLAACCALMVTSDAMAYGGSCERWTYTPPARPYVNPCGEFFVRGDFLYWQAHEDGVALTVDFDTPLEIFERMDQAGPLDTTYVTLVLPEREQKNLSNDWDYGYRIGIGYNSEFDGWDTSLTWTHFNTRATNTHTFIGFNDPSQTFQFEGTGVLYDLSRGSSKTDGSWRTGVNYVDLELGREFFLSPCLTMRPHFGGRYARITQKFNTDSESNWALTTYDVTDGVRSLPTETVPFTSERNVDIRNDYSAGGIRMGVDTQWSLGAGFSLYGQAAFSLLWGRFDVNRDLELNSSTNDVKVGNPLKSPLDKFKEAVMGRYSVTLDQVEDAVDPVTENFLQDFQDYTKLDSDSMKNASDLAIGVRWKQEYDCGTLSLNVGWEQHIFSGQNQFPRYLLLIPNKGGDLSLRGLTVSGTFTF